MYYDDTQLYFVEVRPNENYNYTILLSKKEIQARFRDRWKYGIDNFKTFKIWEADISKGRLIDNREVASKQFLKELESDK